MKRRTFLSLLASSPFLAKTIFAQDIMQPRIPDDPAYRIMPGWGDNEGIPEGLGWQDWFESHTPSAIKDGVILVLDYGINANHPDLFDAWLPQFAKNFSNSPYDDGNLHALGVVSAMLAKANNGISAIGLAGYKNRVKFIVDRTVESDNSTNSSKMRLGYQHALDLKQKDGLNIIAVVLASDTKGDDNQAESLRLIRNLADAGIALIAPAGFDRVNLDTATIKLYPAAYAATEPNVLTAASTDETGTALTQNSPFGVNTVAIAALGLNFQIVDLKSTTTTASYSSTGAAAGQAAGAYAMAWVYRTHQMAKALRRVKLGAVGPITGIQFGRINLGRTLGNFPVRLLTTDKGRLWGLSSIDNQAEPISTTSAMFSSDQRNRLMLFLENVDEPLSKADLTVELKDPTGRVVALIPEAVVEIPKWEWITQVNIKLPSIPQEFSAGEAEITVTARGQSTSAMVSLRQ